MRYQIPFPINLSFLNGTLPQTPPLQSAKLTSASLGYAFGERGGALEELTPSTTARLFC